MACCALASHFCMTGDDHLFTPEPPEVDVTEEDSVRNKVTNVFKTPWDHAKKVFNLRFFIYVFIIIGIFVVLSLNFTSQAQFGAVDPRIPVILKPDTIYISRLAMMPSEIVTKRGESMAEFDKYHPVESNGMNAESYLKLINSHVYEDSRYNLENLVLHLGPLPGIDVGEKYDSVFVEGLIFNSEGEAIASTGLYFLKYIGGTSGYKVASIQATEENILKIIPPDYEPPYYETNKPLRELNLDITANVDSLTPDVVFSAFRHHRFERRIRFSVLRDFVAQLFESASQSQTDPDASLECISNVKPATFAPMKSDGSSVPSSICQTDLHDFLGRLLSDFGLSDDSTGVESNTILTSESTTSNSNQRSSGLNFEGSSASFLSGASNSRRNTKNTSKPRANLRDFATVIDQLVLQPQSNVPSTAQLPLAVASIIANLNATELFILQREYNSLKELSKSTISGTLLKSKNTNSPLKFSSSSEPNEADELLDSLFGSSEDNDKNKLDSQLHSSLIAFQNSRNELTEKITDFNRDSLRGMDDVDIDEILRIKSYISTLDIQTLQSSLLFFLEIAKNVIERNGPEILRARLGTITDSNFFTRKAGGMEIHQVKLTFPSKMVQLTPGIHYVGLRASRPINMMLEDGVTFTLDESAVISSQQGQSSVQQFISNRAINRIEVAKSPQQGAIKTSLTKNNSIGIPLLVKREVSKMLSSWTRSRFQDGRLQLLNLSRYKIGDVLPFEDPILARLIRRSIYRRSLVIHSAFPMPLLDVSQIERIQNDASAIYAALREDSIIHAMDLCRSRLKTDPLNRDCRSFVTSDRLNPGIPSTQFSNAQKDFNERYAHEIKFRLQHPISRTSLSPIVAAAARESRVQLYTSFSPLEKAIRFALRHIINDCTDADVKNKDPINQASVVSYNGVQFSCAFLEKAITGQNIVQKKNVRQMAQLTSFSNDISRLNAIYPGILPQGSSLKSLTRQRGLRENTFIYTLITGWAVRNCAYLSAEENFEGEQLLRVFGFAKRSIDGGCYQSVSPKTLDVLRDNLQTLDISSLNILLPYQMQTQQTFRYAIEESYQFKFKNVRILLPQLGKFEAEYIGGASQSIVNSCMHDWAKQLFSVQEGVSKNDRKFMHVFGSLLDHQIDAFITDGVNTNIENPSSWDNLKTECVLIGRSRLLNIVTNDQRTVYSHGTSLTIEPNRLFSLFLESIGFSPDSLCYKDRAIVIKSLEGIFFNMLYPRDMSIPQDFADSNFIEESKQPHAPCNLDLKYPMPSLNEISILNSRISRQLSHLLSFPSQRFPGSLGITVGYSILLDPIWGILVCVFFLIGVFFISRGAPPELVLLTLLISYCIFGIFDTAVAFRGFGNRGTIALAGLFAVSSILRDSNILEKGIRKVLGRPRDERIALLRLAAATLPLSAIFSNLVSFPILLPIVSGWSAKTASPKRFLMALSIFSSLGGSMTIIGSASNLAIFSGNGLVPTGLATSDLFVPGLIIALTGVVFIVLFNPILLQNVTVFDTHKRLRLAILNHKHSTKLNRQSPNLTSMQTNAEESEHLAQYKAKSSFMQYQSQRSNQLQSESPPSSPGLVLVKDTSYGPLNVSRGISSNNNKNNELFAPGAMVEDYGISLNEGSLNPVSINKALTTHHQFNFRINGDGTVRVADSSDEENERSSYGKNKKKKVKTESGISGTDGGINSNGINSNGKVDSNNDNQDEDDDQMYNRKHLTNKRWQTVRQRLARVINKCKTQPSNSPAQLDYLASESSLRLGGSPLQYASTIPHGVQFEDDKNLLKDSYNPMTLSTQSSKMPAHLQGVSSPSRAAVSPVAASKEAPRGEAARVLLGMTATDHAAALVSHGLHNLNGSDDNSAVRGQLRRNELHHLEFHVIMHLQENSFLIGQTLDDAGLHRLYGVRLIGVSSADGKFLYPPTTFTVETVENALKTIELHVGACLKLAVLPEALPTLRAIDGLLLSVDKHLRRLGGKRRSRLLSEVALHAKSALIRHPIDTARLLETYKMVIISVRRQHGPPVCHFDFDGFQLEPGDVLLVECFEDMLHAPPPAFVLITPVPFSTPPRRDRWPDIARAYTALAGFIIIFIITLALPGWTTYLGTIYLLFLAVLIVIKSANFSQVYSSINGSIILCIGAAHGVANAFIISGAATALTSATFFLQVGSGTIADTPFLRAAGIFVLTAVVSGIMPSMAAVVLMAALFSSTCSDHVAIHHVHREVGQNLMKECINPFSGKFEPSRVSEGIDNETLKMMGSAVSLSTGLKLYEMTILIILALAANCAFLSPVGLYSHAVVMRFAGYSFFDCVRIGYPLIIVLACIIGALASGNII